MGPIDVEPAVRVRGLVRQHGKGESLVRTRAGGTYRHPRQNRGQALSGRGPPGRRHVTAVRPVPAAPAFSGPRSRRCGVRGTRTAPAG